MMKINKRTVILCMMSAMVLLSGCAKNTWGIGETNRQDDDKDVVSDTSGTSVAVADEGTGIYEDEPNLIRDDGENVDVDDCELEAYLHLETEQYNELSGNVLVLTAMDREDLKKVEELDLSCMEYKNLSALPMEYLTNLKTVILSEDVGAEINDLSVFKDNKSITGIGIKDCQVSNLNVLPTIENLSILEMSYSNGQDMSSLKDCKKLEELGIYCEDGSSLEFLNELDTEHTRTDVRCDHPDIESLGSITNGVRLIIRTREENGEEVIGKVSDKVSGLIRGEGWEAVDDDSLLDEKGEDIKEIGKWKLYSISYSACRDSSEIWDKMK